MNGRKLHLGVTSGIKDIAVGGKHCFAASDPPYYTLLPVPGLLGKTPPIITNRLMGNHTDL